MDPSSAHTQVRISHTHASTTNAHVRRPLSAQRSKRTTCRTSACVSRSERIRTAKDHAKRPSGSQAVASDVHGSARHINHHSPTEQRSPGTAAPGSTRSPSSSAFLTTHTATTHRHRGTTLPTTVQGFGRCALPRAASTSGAERATGLWLRRA